MTASNVPLFCLLYISPHLPFPISFCRFPIKNIAFRESWAFLNLWMGCYETFKVLSTVLYLSTLSARFMCINFSVVEHILYKWPFFMSFFSIFGVVDVIVIHTARDFDWKKTIAFSMGCVQPQQQQQSDEIQLPSFLFVMSWRNNFFFASEHKLHLEKIKEFLSQ